MTLPAGTRLGPYEVLSPLGAGGMGEVYRARDKKLDRDVAVKVLHESVGADSETLVRFEREAKAVAALSHPNILAIHDFGNHDGIAYPSWSSGGETLLSWERSWKGKMKIPDALNPLGFDSSSRIRVGLDRRFRRVGKEFLLPLVTILILVGNRGVASAGVNRWTTNGPEAGIILALAIDPAIPATLYAGTTRGVFKSTNGGGSWSAINTGLTESNVRALAIDPTPPATIYAGTGDVLDNGGVFKSTNGGDSWSAINTGLTNKTINALGIDPATPATLYAGSYVSGVFKSTNGGDSWSASNAGLTTTGVFALVVDPSAPATLYVGTNPLFPTGGGAFKSTNGGASWTAMNAGLIDTAVLVLAIDPTTPATLYAGTGGYGVFKSTNGGGSWTAINAGLTNPPDGGIGALAVDPSAPATLYAYSGDNGGVFKSTNGGGSWTAMNAGLTNKTIGALAIDPLTPTRLYAGTGGGGVFDWEGLATPTTRGQPRVVHFRSGG